MVTRVHTKLLAALGACAMALLLSGNSVLCVGSNGHIALERISAHCCSGSKSGFGTVTLAFTSPLSRLAGCGDCADTQLSAAAPTAQHKSDTALTPPASPVVAAEWPASTRHSLPQSVPNPDRLPRSDLSLIFARTISLRC
jgi:hypothetical protein